MLITPFYGTDYPTEQDVIEGFHKGDTFLLQIDVGSPRVIPIQRHLYSDGTKVCIHFGRSLKKARFTVGQTR